MPLLYNYSMTSESFWNWYRDEVNNDAIENNDTGNYRTNNKKTIKSTFYEHETKIIGNTPTDVNTLDTEIVVPFKYLTKFCKFLDFFFNLLWNRAWFVMFKKM